MEDRPANSDMQRMLVKYTTTDGANKLERSVKIMYLNFPTLAQFFQEWEQLEIVIDFISLGAGTDTDGKTSREIGRCLLLATAKLEKMHASY